METLENLKKFQKNILETYTCVICQEYAVDIQTSNCSCNVVFCKECSKPIKTCPICHKCLDLSSPSFRILNILKEILEYKKHEEKIKEDLRKKIPSIEDIQMVWSNTSYSEKNNSYSENEAKKAEEFSRRFVYGFLCTAKNIGITKMWRTWDVDKRLKEFPIILTYEGIRGRISLNAKFRSDCIVVFGNIHLTIVLAFAHNLKNVEIPYNLFDLYYKKTEEN